ncbi:hypothetical protein ZIOFF_070839 [Zingiber officinale]|uniref:Uncharacterized protein n=1 Tax=Zingiber officinale TaxID=94328 RepID=A0A8J5ETB8_ZINOF|nr:hypothetical protein ZIOFF_070839 [Zingiber officinale]
MFALVEAKEAKDTSTPIIDQEGDVVISAVETDHHPNRLSMCNMLTLPTEEECGERDTTGEARKGTRRDVTEQALKGDVTAQAQRGHDATRPISGRQSGRVSVLHILRRLEWWSVSTAETTTSPSWSMMGVDASPCFLSLLHQREHGRDFDVVVERARMEVAAVELEKLVRLRRTITLYRGSIQLKVRDVLVENDPDMETLHSLDCIRLPREVYDKPGPSNR